MNFDRTNICVQETDSTFSVGPLAARTPGEIVSPLIDKITNLTNSGNIDISIPNAALRTLIASLPQPQSAGITAQDVKDAYAAVSKVLIPRLVGSVVLPTGKPTPQLPPGLLDMHTDKGYSSDAVDVMIEIVKCYGPLLQEAELDALSKSVMAIIESPYAGGVVKKRALAGIGALLVHFNDQQLSHFVSTLIESFHNPHLTAIHRRFLIATIGTLAKSTPGKFGPYLKTLAPFVLSALSQFELDENVNDSDEEAEIDPEIEELRETALVALEAVLGSCSSDMQSFLTESVEAALRYLKYDPNIAESEDEEMGGTQDAGSDDGETEEAVDEDDEYAELDEEGAFSDVDDLSWKVRRCAAKVLYTVINISSAADQKLLFGTIAPVLVSRLSNEREENVRLEVISATTALIRKTGTGVKHVRTATNSATDTFQQPNSRKRRRQDSEGHFDDPEISGLVPLRSSPPILPATPPSGAQADLAMFIPRIVQALTRLWKKASISLKQAAVVMLKYLALSRNGALADHLQQIEDPLADALKPSGFGLSAAAASSGSSATGASLQIETLTLISAVAETNSNTVLIPFVIALIPSVTTTVRDRNYKVSSESLGTIEQFVKALTPPRLPTTNQDYAVHLEKLYSVVMDRVTDNNADLEARHRAIQVFGVLLARTSSTNLLSASARTKGLGILSDRLRNETTRLSSARAIGVVAAAASAQDNMGGAWVQEVSLEMASHLRKADRALRGSCLEALQFLALNPVTSSQYDTSTIQELKTQLLPLLSTNDLHLLTPALVICAKIIPTNPRVLVDAELADALCAIARGRLEGPPLKAFLLVVKVIGEQKVGAELMAKLLAVGTEGEALVVGRAIGTLTVFGGADIGISVSQFLNEVDNGLHTNPSAASLALTVLGEVGYRMGPSSPLDISVFEKGLSSESDKVRLSAAVALGSASASNIPKFLPIILQQLSSSVSQDYLLLYAIKEILQHSEGSSAELAAYAPQLWEKLFSVSDAEDNLAVGAECIGRLALIDPTTYVPELHRSLQDANPSKRGIVISAFRFTLTDTSRAYNDLLGKEMLSMLTTMLSDKDIQNRRLGVTTLNAAIHNKPELIIPELSQILPLVLADSYVKPELIKTVSIGPFKHNEDSGLDLRKSTYATMYALLDTPAALPHISIASIYDRLLDGITDDNDVRTLCMLMIGRLASLDPDETRRRLSPLAERFKVVLGQKIKENAVKQEIEKVNEANTAVVRTTLDLDKSFPSAATDGSGEMVIWKGYLDFVRKDFGGLVRNIQNEGLE